MDSTDPFARLAQPKSEVRRCPKCGESALICFQAWEHSFNRRSTGAITRSCRCQACGAYATLRDPKQIRNSRILGWVLLPTVLPSLLVLTLVSAWKRAWTNSPLLPDAPFPVIRYQSGQPDRRCAACQQVARLTDITRHKHNGIPTGTTYKFTCEGCQRTFKTESTGGLILSGFFVLMFCGAGLGMLVAPGVAAKDSWMGLLCLAGGLAFLYLVGKRVLAARNNPEIPTPHLLA